MPVSSFGFSLQHTPIEAGYRISQKLSIGETLIFGFEKPYLCLPVLRRMSGTKEGKKRERRVDITKRGVEGRDHYVDYS